MLSNTYAVAQALLVPLPNVSNKKRIENKRIEENSKRASAGPSTMLSPKVSNKKRIKEKRIKGTKKMTRNGRQMVRHKRRLCRRLNSAIRREKNKREDTTTI